MRHVMGSAMAELQQALPGQSRAQLKRLLDGLRSAGLVRLEGERRWARCFAQVPLVASPMSGYEP